MNTETTTKKHTLDARGKRLGRFASHIAHILLGKDTTNFAKNKIADVVITVENVDLLDISDKKSTTKVYDRYSGYPGGRKEETLSDVVAQKGTKEVLIRAVYNMLPANRLRNGRMKNLIIT